MEAAGAPQADVVACNRGTVCEVHRYLSKLTAGDRSGLPLGRRRPADRLVVIRWWVDEPALREGPSSRWSVPAILGRSVRAGGVA
jgi:hypothetical protein